MYATRLRGSIRSLTFPIPTGLWRSRTSRKLQATTTSTSRKRHGTNWAFISKRIEERLPPKDLERGNAESRAKSPLVRESIEGVCGERTAATPANIKRQNRRVVILLCLSRWLQFQHSIDPATNFRFVHLTFMIDWFPTAPEGDEI